MRFCLSTQWPAASLPAMGSIEQSEAEESMSDWLTDAGVENAFSIAPTLVGIGLQRGEDWHAPKKFFTPAIFPTH